MRFKAGRSIPLLSYILMYKISEDDSISPAMFDVLWQILITMSDVLRIPTLLQQQ